MIYFTLNTRIPETLYAEFNGIKAEIGIDIVPTVLDAHKNGEVLLYEEKIKLAVIYLRNIFR